MKIPEQIRQKRIPQIQEIYNTSLENTTSYEEKIYEVVNLLESEDENRQQKALDIIDNLNISKEEKDKIKSKPFKYQIRQIVKNLILESLSETMSYTIEKVKEYYPSSFEDNKIELEKLLYREDNKTFNERINDWFTGYFREEVTFETLRYHMLLTLSTETYHLIPQIIKNKLNKEKTYIEILPGGGCDRACCNSEYSPGEAYPEDDVELPPYHTQCQCEAIFYEQDDFKKILNEDES